jgi:hypothetical protein
MVSHGVKCYTVILKKGKLNGTVLLEPGNGNSN